MAENTKTYNPAAITIAFGLIPITGGFAPNTFVAVKKSEGMYKRKRGVDGTVARAKTNAFDGTVEITILATAVANGLLSAQATLDEQSTNGAGVAPLIIENRNGTQAFFASEAWIEERPDIEYSDEVGENTWVIGYANAVRVDGGQ